jgi:hypothetical protein
MYWRIEPGNGCVCAFRPKGVRVCCPLLVDRHADTALPEDEAYAIDDLVAVEAQRARRSDEHVEEGDDRDLRGEESLVADAERGAEGRRGYGIFAVRRAKADHAASTLQVEVRVRWIQ